MRHRDLNRNLAIFVCLCLVVGVVPAAGSARQEGPGKSESTGTITLIPSSPENGFQFPYVLRVPDEGDMDKSCYLLVEPNNSGHVSEKFEDHVDAAMALAQKAVGSDLLKRLHVPLLVPVFPRSEALYTHSLNRRTMDVADGPLVRLDLQLLSMIEDARRRLAERGITIQQKILLTGFSASGAFANRFTALHPDKVAAVAAGAVNGMLILPRSSWDTETLLYPIGVADIETLCGQRFDLDAWKQVPQFIYMGADDNNDAVAFDDAYTADERAQVYRLLGETMQPDRWEQCQKQYLDAGANVVFRTYQGIGHATNGKIHAELAEFFQKATRPEPK